MFKKTWRIFTILVLCSLFTQPVMAAATDGQGGGGVRFGSYTLDSGNTTSGDLVIIGGPVSFEELNQIIHNPSLYASPPEGYTFVDGMKISPDSWKQVVD